MKHKKNSETINRQARRGDNIEIKISDNYFNVYYKNKVELGDKKRMKILFEDLKAQGIDFDEMNIDTDFTFFH